MKHKHAELMMQYAQDAQETPEPWERWEFSSIGRKWSQLTSNPTWVTSIQYRRKPKMLSVTLANGDVVSWPEPHKGDLNVGQHCYLVKNNGDVEHVCFAIHSHNNMVVMFGMVHLTKEAAEQHSHALFKINNQVVK